MKPQRRAGGFGALLLLSLSVLASGMAQAATITVSRELGLAFALKQAQDGDVVELPAGNYYGQVATITQKQLTLRGLPDATGKRPVLHADGRSAEQKAILVVRDGDVRIENIEFRGARVEDRNGAGIRFEKGRLHVLRCAFVDNENGILTTNFAEPELLVQDSEFSLAPANTPLPHHIYAGRIARLMVVGSRFSGGNEGHLIKSRAVLNVIVGNVLVDGPGGRAAYELDFPNGGLAYLVNNVVAQSAGTTNPVLVSFGEEGYLEREHALVMLQNTLVNDGPAHGSFMRVSPSAKPVQQRFMNNLLAGPGDARAFDVKLGNAVVPRATLDEAAAARQLPGLPR
jgi:hypothetical protein